MLVGSSRPRRDLHGPGAWRRSVAPPGRRVAGPGRAAGARRRAVALPRRAVVLLGPLLLLVVVSPTARAMAAPAESAPLAKRAVQTPVATASSPIGSRAVNAIRFALAQVGKRYRWGGNGPTFYDCSGLTSMAYRSAGVAIPRVSRLQYAHGEHVPLRWLVPGDLVFYAKDTKRAATVHHVALYIGSGRMVEAANPRVRIRVASIWRRGLMPQGVRPDADSTRALPVRDGERGATVATVQSRLRAAGRCLAVDGAFGPITLAGVRGFQRAHGIATVGYVGPRTWAALATSGRQQRHRQNC
jgi:cell wall-associated NlpC family hydrolase